MLGPQGPQAVEQQPDLHPLPRFFRQRLHDGPPGLVAPEDKGGDVDGMLRALDQLDQRMKGALAVEVNRHRVSRPGRGHGARAKGPVRKTQGSHGFRGLARARVEEVGLTLAHPPNLAPAEENVQRHAHIGNQDDGQGPRHGAARLAVLPKHIGQHHHGQQETAHRDGMLQQENHRSALSHTQSLMAAV